MWKKNRKCTKPRPPPLWSKTNYFQFFLLKISVSYNNLFLFLNWFLLFLDLLLLGNNMFVLVSCLHLLVFVFCFHLFFSFNPSSNIFLSWFVFSFSSPRTLTDPGSFKMFSFDPSPGWLHHCFMKSESNCCKPIFK